MTPKSLLRHSDARSPITDMTEGTSFQRVYVDTECNEGVKVQRVIFCTGKIYYELKREQKVLGLTGRVALVRLEQLSPFPYDVVMAELQRYPSAELVWAQEEPKNMGAWSYIQPRLHTSTGRKKFVRYVGRCASASVATGNKATHTQEQKAVIRAAFENI